VKIDITILISVISVFSAVLFAVKNAKRQDDSEVEKKAVETATINVKLDSIGNDVKDIKYDITAMKKEVGNLTERMVVVEQSTKSAHKRIDEIIEEKER
jgi:peptidoglycan hydrolase CwlO-like protein